MRGLTLAEAAHASRAPLLPARAGIIPLLIGLDGHVRYPQPTRELSPSSYPLRLGSSLLPAHAGMIPVPS